MSNEQGARSNEQGADSLRLMAYGLRLIREVLENFFEGGGSAFYGKQRQVVLAQVVEHGR